MEIEKAKETNTLGVVPFLVGTAVGATLGVLYAPRAGDENRRRLADWIKEKRENGRNKFAGMRKHDKILAEV